MQEAAGQEEDADPTRSRPGRPTVNLKINLQKPYDAGAMILRLVRDCKELREGGHTLSHLLREGLCLQKSQGTQTEQAESDEVKIMEILASIQELNISDINFILVELFSAENNRLRTFMQLYEILSCEDQIDVFATLGNLLNQTLYDSTIGEKPIYEISIDDLVNVSKKDLYDKVDPRLKSFVDNITKKRSQRRREASGERGEKETVNYKYNVIENLQKERNKNYVSQPGLKEHLCLHLASSKSIRASQVMSKVGAKGSIKSVEKVLSNSVLSFKVTLPDLTTCNLSFDNIQCMLKSHRLGPLSNAKPIVVVTTSALATLPEGFLQSDIQYQSKLSPSYWLYSFKYDQEKDLYINELDKSVLKEIASCDTEDHKIIKQIFDEELEKAFNYVYNDLDSNDCDSIDAATRAETKKKRRLCTNMHINEIKRSNQKFCKVCKAELKPEQQEEVMEESNTTESQNDDEQLTNAERKAEEYYNISCNIPTSVPVEIPIGAMEVNPNTSERIKKVLDELLESVGLQNNYPVRLKFEDGKVTKILNMEEQSRKWTMCTVDGLPFKELIDILKDNFKCAICGFKAEHIANLNDHMKETTHNEFFQSYGAVLPNIGHFHYGFTLLRSFTKLLWNIDFSELAKAIHLETEKAQLMIQKQTNYRKGMDFCKIARRAKLREFAYPFVREAKEEDTEISIDKFYDWKESVQNETYKSLFEIEQIYGTSLFVYHASVRANNFALMNVAKRTMSPLFHINSNNNYSVIDIYTDYLHRLQDKIAPDVSLYMEDKYFSNFTLKPYHASGHDERHEEFNKRGLAVQKPRNADDFKASFKLVGLMQKVTDSVFEEYEIKPNRDNSERVMEYEENISKMRIQLRQSKYLSRPEKEQGAKSIDGKDLNKDLKDIVQIANSQRQTNVINGVLRHNNMMKGYDPKGKIKIFKNDEEEDNLLINFDLQLDILVEAEEDIEKQKDLRDYIKEARKQREFDPEKLVNDLLDNTFQFL